MRNLWIIVLVVAVTGCSGSGGIGNANTHAFVATPVPDEIRTVTYSIQTPTGTNTWRLTNDDLRIRLVAQSRSGKVLSIRTRKMTPNDYNWVVYNLEQANFTKVKSSPRKNQSRANEVLTAITQSGTHSYTQNSSTRFPNGFQKVIDVIPSLSNK